GPERSIRIMVAASRGTESGNDVSRPCSVMRRCSFSARCAAGSFIVPSNLSRLPMLPAAMSIAVALLSVSAWAVVLGGAPPCRALIAALGEELKSQRPGDRRRFDELHCDRVAE